MPEVITENVSKLVDLVLENGGRAYAVRDFALSEALRRFGYDSFSDNLDIEIYNIDRQRVENILISNFGKIETEGNFFYLDGVSILVPNSEMKQSAKEKVLILDSFFLDLKTGEIKDYFEGLIDIQRGFVGYVDKKYFQSSIMNVFRAVQLVSQLNFRLDKDIFDTEMCFSFRKLSKDFIFNYWKDLLLNSPCPSIGIEALREVGILKGAHMELNNLVGVGQNPDWHHEGDAWTHTKMVLDAGARISRLWNLSEDDALVLMLACLCHDLGKPIVTKLIDGKLSAKGHDKEGETPTRAFLEQIGTPCDICNMVIPLVIEHMFTHRDDFKEEEVRALADRISPAKVIDLIYLAEADCQGMINCQKDSNSRNDLLEVVRRLGIE